MRRHSLVLVVVVVALTAIVAPVADAAPVRSGAAVKAPAETAAVLAWNQHATDALIGTAAQPPNVAVLHMAMVEGAVYDAVNAIDGGHEPYLVAPRAKRWYSTDAAAATAAYRVLVNVVPAQQAHLQELYQASLDAIPDGWSGIHFRTADEQGATIGKQVAHWSRTHFFHPTR
jgi:hypothetical protein